MISFLKKIVKTRPQTAKTTSRAIEPLEVRQMLSAAVQTVQYDSTVLAYATNSATIAGYTPSQIKAAYQFDKAAFTNSSVAATGAGQTIAIVDAYNDPNISGDLGVFDSQFGLSAPPSLKVVSQSGTGSLPSTDAGWAGEISLDVEWAHAMAPGANILLVEASSDSITDLTDAVNYARKVAGVSVVSMSWGGSEFFSWGGGQESSSQTYYDPIFTTPSGHQGVTFVASAGDSGTYSGVQWPASSPNVLSVGGTSLYTSDSAGTYSTESSWSGTSSGYSQVEVQPAYQNAVQNTGARSVADVSYDADPNTGFAVYDSVPEQGYTGWQEVGGTSAGAPQWAALIAIADQGRVLSGQTTLDGPTQTLPMLYNLYGTTADGSDSSTYSADFNDVIDSSSYYGGDPWHWGWGGWGYPQGAATSGYDNVTGLGTPKAASLIDSLIGTSGSSSSSSGSSGSSGNAGSSGSSGSTTPAALPASPLTGVFTDAPLANVVEGTNGTLELQLTNVSGSKFSGPVSVSLYASADNSLSADDALITTINLKKVNIGASHSKDVKLKFSYPTTLSSGTYNIVGSISATATNTASAEADALASVSIAAQNVDLATAFKNPTVKVDPGHRDNVAVTITNDGNVTASGLLSLNLYASTTSTLDTAAAQILAALSDHLIHLKAGHSMTLHLHFTAPISEAAGAYYLIIATNSSTTPSDTNTANDTATAVTVA